MAAAAGVSTQTVSRVINNRPDVAPETLERVQEVIRETGYAPNMLARGLTQGRSHVLGVVAYGLEYFGPSRVVSAIERQAAEMGYGISLNLILEPETDDVEHVLSSLRSRQVDGIIWAIPEVGNNRAWSRAKGAELPVPVMLVGGMVGKTNLPSIAIDNAAIGRLATEHLLAGGARHVGIVTGPLTWWEAQQRLGRLAADDRSGGTRGRGLPDRRRRLDRRPAASRACTDCSRSAPISTPSSPATTRWPWASSTRPTARPAESPRTSPSSASTTSPRRRTSGRRSRRSISRWPTPAMLAVKAIDQLIGRSRQTRRAPGADP